MIKNIIDSLQVSKGETENNRIPLGKYALPSSFSKAFKQIKKEIQWLRK